MMPSTRALGVLGALSTGRPTDASRDEVDELVRAGFARELSRADQADLAAQAGALDEITDQLRTLRRAVDASFGPKARSGPGAGSRGQLVGLSRSFEETDRAAARLRSLVANGPTGDFLEPTTPGRQVVADLATWEPELGDLPFGEFVARLAQLHGAIDTTLRQAEEILPWMARLDPRLSAYSLRGPALLLARAPGGPVAAVQKLFAVHRSGLADIADPEDRLLAATVLATSPVPEADLISRYSTYRTQFLSALAGLSMDATRGPALMAASLADLPADQVSGIVDRLGALSRSLPNSGSLGLTVLARSPWPTDEAAQRVSAATDAIRTAGHSGEDPTPTAAALLAASRRPTSEFGPSIEWVDRAMHEMFLPSQLASALLASLALTPAQAVDMFHRGIAAVSRWSYYDLTAEIHYLGLLATYGVGPAGVDLSPVAGIPPPPAAVYSPFVGSAYWFVAPHLQMHRAFLSYVAVHPAAIHPAHVHTAAAFG